MPEFLGFKRDCIGTWNSIALGNKGVENIVGKGENAGILIQHTHQSCNNFNPFPHSAAF